MKIYILSILLVAGLKTSAQVTWPYLGETPPLTAIDPIIFGAGKISTNYNERDITFSPDGTEIYFSIQFSFTSSVIAYTKYEDGKWSRVKVAPFSSLATVEIEPAFTPDGSRLFFASMRTGDFDIWYVDRNPNGGWSEPINAGPNVNTGANEFYPSVTSNGALYYTAPYSGNEDIWVSSLSSGVYQTPQALSTAINTLQGEFNAFVTPDGNTIYFGSEKSGRGDIYRSSRFGGDWAEPTRLLLNSGALDYCPSESPSGSPGGSYFFFTSERGVKADPSPNPFEVGRVIKAHNKPRGSGGDIYWSK